jgi:hypothetical protein
MSGVYARPEPTPHIIFKLRQTAPEPTYLSKLQSNISRPEMHLEHSFYPWNLQLEPSFKLRKFKLRLGVRRLSYDPICDVYSVFFRQVYFLWDSTMVDSTMVQGSNPAPVELMSIEKYQGKPSHWTIPVTRKGNWQSAKEHFKFRLILPPLYLTLTAIEYVTVVRRLLCRGSM